jgi:hypothetical protein
MRKKLLFFLGAVLIALSYYFFVKPSEFEVNFRAKTLPGDLIQTIRIWNRSLVGSTIMEVDSFSRLRQSIAWNNRNYIYDWEFSTADDSTTKVSIQISEPDRVLLNKLLIPFTDQVIEKDAEEIARKYFDLQREHLRITSVKIIGEDELDISFCVCHTLETKQVEKANGMMRDYPLITAFIDDQKLEAKGRPMVRVMQWDHNLDFLKFDFCFPIQPVDTLQLAEGLSYKKFDKIKVLKAEYHGNYITSDRAWYELIRYAHKNGYEVAGPPIEYFHDNPNMGLNEINWKADVFLPIKY